MKKQILIIGALLCGSLLLQATGVQSLVVQPKTGSQNTFALNDIQKITFSSGTMSLIKTDATQSDYTISEVQKLWFAMVNTTAISEVTSASSNLAVYPNPTADVLFIKGAAASSQAKVYNLSGIALSVPSTHLADGLQLNVSALPQGVYLIQIDGEIIKFQKR